MTSITVDIDGQPRPADKPDVGADQFSKEPAINRPLTESDIGPNAPQERDRPLISAPLAAWRNAPSEPRRSSGARIYGSHRMVFSIALP